MSDDHVPGLGPVMAFTAKRAEVVRFYTEIAGLKAETEPDATWLAAENAQLVVHDPDDRQTEPDVRGQRGFVLWFGIDDVATAYARAKAAGWAIGEFHGDYFFARDPDGRYVVMSSHVSLVVDPLLHYGSDALKDRFLRPLATGEKLGCFALSEPASGSDAAAMRTSARRDGDGWVLNGTKNFITNGASADLAIVFAQTDANSRHRGIAAFVVEKGTPGFSVGKLEHKLGIRGSDTAQLIFQDCRVPGANLLGEAGQGFKIALSTLDGGRISIAAQAVGIARACLEDSLAYAKEREAFGKKVADFQAIQWMLADMATEIDAARLLTWRAAALKDAGEDYILAAAEAKLFASDIAVKASRDCVQIFGGYGYLKDFPAERHYRDAKITEIYEGTSEIMKLVIAEEILKE